MRRKPGALLPIEVAIIDAALQLQRSGEDTFHGFGIARVMAQGDDTGRLTSHGTLYKALGRLEAAGLLTSTWEDADEAAAEGRPRRRLYKIDGAAASVALAEHRQSSSRAPQASGRAAWGTP
ncbi:PadR family transcriptional regulator [Microbacterium sp. E-13]|uniref:PadR family transcriptional regulator n=1 Tax=Microbacterium sp. E-13 TaxID=3404048 RepID=UPI003CEA7EEA